MFKTNYRLVLGLALATVAGPDAKAAAITFMDAGAGAAFINVAGADAASVTFVGTGCVFDGSGGEICIATILRPGSPAHRSRAPANG